MSDERQQSSTAFAGGWFYGPQSRVGYAWAALAFLVDQAHKWWMLNIIGINEGDRLEVIPGIFDLVLVWNRGVSYGLLQQEGLIGRLALVLFALLAVIGLAIWLARGEHSRLNAVAIGLIMGGALGNALDRLIREGVADFFDFYINGYHWYTFNIADIAIVAGVAALLYDAVFISPKTAVKPSQDG